ncbi:hypothetical protein LCGC14_2716740, partial [marine sediment metagenome]
GPPAVGKTTLAEHLAAELPAGLIREDYAGNPFLAESYLQRGRSALAAQLYFLFSRLGQLNLQTWPEAGTAVIDYGFCQDAIYAAANLTAEELKLYRELADGADRLVKAPDVMVLLDGDEQLLLERIARRGRRFERTFTADFLRSLREAYRRVAAGAAFPVIEVDVRQVDLMARADLDELRGRIEEALR